MPMVLRTSILSFLFLWTAACGKHPVQGYGLEQRQTVQGLQFPTGLPQPSTLQPVVAFPNLTFAQPVFFTAVPDGSNRVVVVQQAGLVRIFANDPAVGATSTYLDLSGRVLYGGEEGLLGLAFHPDYAQNGWCYVYYSMDNPRRSVISRFQVQAGDPNAADLQSETILLQFERPFSNHNGGSMAFGPDGMLYVSTGDGGSANDPYQNAQNLTVLLGKMLRLAPDGSIPPDNPFASGSNGERGEIWCYGLRNPWRISFDRATGALWVGDVGQDTVEEVDIVQRGGNYGWRVYEGDRSNINPANLPASAFAAPVRVYDRSQGNCVIGGYVYRGAAMPALSGAYLYADNGSGHVWALVWDGSQVVDNVQVADVASPTSFGEDAAGEVHVCSFDGNVYRFTASGGGSSGTIPATLSAAGLFTDLATLTPVPGLVEYGVQSPLWSDGARKRRFLALPGQSHIQFDAEAAWVFPVGTVLVKHFEIDAPAGPLRLETRVLMQRTTGWQGFTYRWNGAGTDADLLQTGGDLTFTAQPPGGSPRQQTWHFPSEAECYRCHTSAAGRVLGVHTRQLNGSFQYPLVADNQLRSWNHIGLFTTDIGFAQQYGAFADPADTTAPVGARARSWLAANCAQCHRPLGGTPVDLDLRFQTDPQDMHAIGVASAAPVPGGIGARITAGSKEQSDLWLRIQRRDGFGMPPVGSNVADDAAVALIGAWIDQGANR